MITNKYFLTTRNIPTYIKYLIAKKQSGGGLPAGYQELEYIESVDESWQTVQYIDTGVKGDLNTKAEIDFEPTGNQFRPFGTDSGPYVKNFCIKQRGASIGSKINIGINDYLYNGAESTNKRYNISMSYNDGIFIDGVLVEKWTNISSFETDRTLPVFCYNGNGRNYPMKMKLYNLKIYKENVLVRDFIPALRESDNKPRHV